MSETTSHPTSAARDGVPVARVFDPAAAEMLANGALAMDLSEPLTHFLEHGWARIGNVATKSTLALLRSRADDLMMGRVTYPDLFFQLDTKTGNYDDLTYGKGYQGPSLNYRKVEKVEQDPLFGAWINNPLFERVARACIERPDEGIAIYRAVIFSKGADGGTELPWHQDGGVFWGLDQSPRLQIWTALDDAPEEAGCVEVFDRSHMGGLATRLGGVVPAPVVDAADANRRALPLPARAGDVLLIDNYLWHRSGINRSGQPRRAFTVCYMNAGTRCLRKKRAPRNFVRVFCG
jgi:phytanoyl-CoA hydroxylase